MDKHKIEIEVPIIVDADEAIEKLERIKSLLIEIKSLSDDISIKIKM